MLLSVS